MNIKNKLILSITIGLIAIYASIIIFIRQQLQEKIIQDAVEEMQLTAHFIQSHLEQHTIHVEEIIQNTALQITESNIPISKIEHLIIQTLKNNPGEIYGMSFSYDPKIQYAAPYAYHQDSAIISRNLAQVEGYEYEKTNWFKEASEDSTYGWTSTYFDHGGGDTKMITYYYPVLREGQRIGFLTGDLCLDWMEEWMHQKFTQKFEHHQWIVNSLTHEIITPSKGLKINKELFHKSKKNTVIPPVSLLENTSEKNSIYLLQLPMSFNDWNLNISFQKSDVLKAYNQTIFYLKIAFALGLILLIVMTSIAINHFTKPLIVLSKAITSIGNGRFNIKIPYQNRKDEIGTLSNSFVNMQNDLVKHIKDLKATTKENARIQNELDIGHKIQMSLLPDEHTIQHLTSFKVRGYMQAAKEVGGDLYDFFEVSDQNICFVVGDVSGKGIPAALWMASVRASIRAYAQMGLSPAEILTKVNRDICKKNSLYNFVTLFCAITDQKNQQLIFCNAGHERPFLLTEGSPVEVSSTPQMALGIDPQKVYHNQTILISSTATLVIYSDGVTDAMNHENQNFGKENFLQILSQTTDIHHIVENTKNALHEFCFKAEPFDDITILAIQMNFNTNE